MIDLEPAARPSARDMLRTATRETHERLHEHPRLKPLAEGTIGLREYRDLLARLYGFHQAVDAAFARQADIAPFNVAARRKAPLLREDLLALGLDAAGIGNLPLCRDLPPLDSAAALCGCAYVVEGSTLGGRVLAQAVAPLLGQGIEGRRFLLGYGEQHGAMWRTFTRTLEAVPQRERVAMTAAAVATFAVYESWISREG